MNGGPFDNHPFGNTSFNSNLFSLNASSLFINLSSLLSTRSGSPQRSGSPSRSPSLDPNIDKISKKTKHIQKIDAAERQQIRDEVRGRLRERTQKNGTETEDRRLATAKRQTAQHVRATGRAISNTLAPNTLRDNTEQVEQLRTDKAYKDGTLRIHFKGDRFTDDSTGGTSLSGMHLGRSSWNSDQKVVNYHLSETLKNRQGFIGAPNRTGEHGAEIAHLRAQHAGGLTDELGAQSASWHSNVEDMAREESQAKLATLFDSNVRLKSTAYIHESGPLMGTVKASRHKIYFKNQDDGKWYKKFDHLQDGARGNINLDEVNALKNQITALSPKSLDTTLHPGLKTNRPHHDDYKGIHPGSDTKTQSEFRPLANDTTVSPYFTDIRSSNGTWQKNKADAGTLMSNLISEAATQIRNTHGMFFRPPPQKKKGKKK